MKYLPMFLLGASIGLIIVSALTSSWIILVTGILLALTNGLLTWRAFTE